MIRKVQHETISGNQWHTESLLEINLTEAGAFVLAMVAWCMVIVCLLLAVAIAAPFYLLAYPFVMFDKKLEATLEADHGEYLLDTYITDDWNVHSFPPPNLRPERVMWVKLDDVDPQIDSAKSEPVEVEATLDGKPVVLLEYTDHPSEPVEEKPKNPRK